ncbi:IQ motif and ankyrin repeat domain-containing protein 1-like [Montipora capricornis]|uniref:IQ motif and ankyrin repeat domain-containing protein 1-like n=1 Tax=Montipora capricornis TaxID=246305 RepID=UPI0035F19EA3
MAPKRPSPAVKTGVKSTPQKPVSKAATSAPKPSVKVGATTSAKSGFGGSKTAPAKKGSTSPTKGQAKGKGKENIAVNQTKGKKWTKQDESAVIIQKYTRRHLAKKELEKRRREKQKYEELMDKIQKEAWLKLVQMEREEAEKERKKEEEERRKKREEAKRRNRILEAAFDGDNDEIVAVLEEAYEEDSKRSELSEPARQSLITRHQVALVDCEDANNNTPLSEAAGGGHADTIKMLIQRGANLNSRGRYKRVPLWRAAFGGHLQAVQTLLEHGGDPRLVADDGTNAMQVAAIPAVEQVLQEWDIKQTDKLLEKLEAEKNNRQEEERKLREAESNRLEKEIEKAEKENQAHQRELAKAHCELNKRIYEHDKCMAEGKTDKREVTLQAIHDAEAVLGLAQKKAEASKEALGQVKLKLREQNNTEENSKDATAEVKGVKVMLRDLDDVLLRDVGGKIAEDGRWPLLIDTSPQSSTFLRYRDTNYINALNPKHVEPEVIRMALLGGLRYGKPVVLDMMEVDMFDTVTMRFDDVQKGLMASLMSKELLKDSKFLELIRPGDGEEYSKTSFLGARIEKFLFIIITQQWNPQEKLMDQTYPIRVIIPSRPDV